MLSQQYQNKINPPKTQKGLTLIELMVGIAVGLMVVAVAAGALMASRSMSSTVSDAGQLQQQASYAFRVLGQQIRQAGSMRLNLAVNKGAGEAIAPEDYVAFAPDINLYSSDPNTPPPTPIVSGKDAPGSSEFKLALAYQNYEEQTFPSGTEQSFFRDCLGNQPSSTVIESQFVLDTTKNELECAGADDAKQPILRNVADFQVQYLVQTINSAGNPTMQFMDAAAVGANWNRVFGLEVCLVLYGNEVINLPAGTSYLGCDNQTITDITNIADTAQRNRMHKVFRTVYQIRSQGTGG